MNTASTPPTSYQTARALLKEFQQKFEVIRECKPLAIGIDKQLFDRFPEVSRRSLRIALGIHTNSMRYLKAMASATVRYDLDGQEVGEIDPAHLEHAVKALKERIKKDGEKRKAQRKAEEEKRKAEEADRKRQEKLEQLQARFSRSR